MNLTAEERVTGTANWDMTRRDFMIGTAAAGAVTASALGGFYFGYKSVENPVRVGVIGTGDEGGVLMSNISPDYLQVVAIADIRPYNVWRAFHGDQTNPGSLAARQGLISRYGWSSEDEARKHVKVYTQGYQDLLNDPNVEMVIIALPLHLHAPVAIEAMAKGKHVLTEKLMAHNIGDCKKMAAAAKEHGKLLAVGHQRHYSVLYDDAVASIRADVLGKIHHIRAQWHRVKDTWSPPMHDRLALDLAKQQARLEELKPGIEYDDVQKKVRILTEQVKDTNENVQPEKNGYLAKEFHGRQRSALEELIRWRLWDRTGGGLMAELGSHQLDASSIFVSAAHPKGADGKSQKIKPLTVSATGGIHLYDKTQRECEDHVYCTYEFPAPGDDPDKKIVVTYSSINGNGFGNYGEVVMGDKGTLVLDRESEVLLFPNGGAPARPAAAPTVAKVETKAAGAPAADSYESGGGGPGAKKSGSSRGYTEEMEHFAYCLRNNLTINDLRCNPKVAMADAIIALTTNIALRQNRRVEFKPEWFDLDNPATPEADLKA